MLPAVHFHELRAFLPREVSGLTAARDEGSTGRYGEVAISEAERSFVRKDAELIVRIVDSTMAPRLGASIREAVEFGRAHPVGGATPEPLDGMVGFVRYDPDGDQAEANVLVADRYVVAVTGYGFGDARLVREVVTNVDVAGLSRLR